MLSFLPKLSPEIIVSILLGFHRISVMLSNLFLYLIKNNLQFINIVIDQFKKHPTNDPGG